MNPHHTTYNTWNSVASLYQEKFMGLDLYNDSYDRFCELIESVNARVLDIGCGPGNISKYVGERRKDLQISGIDYSPNMIELAKLNNPKAQFEVMDCRDIASIKETFHGVIAGFCLPYLSINEAEQFFSNCFDLLEQKGVFYVSTIEGSYSQSGFVTASTGDKCFVHYYEENDIRGLLIKQGFDVVEVMRKNNSKQDGSISHEMIFIAQK